MLSLLQSIKTSIELVSQELPSVIPMISYEDGLAALDWLSKAFGFEENSRITGPDGRLAHAEMKTGQGGAIMLATPTPEYQAPRRHREVCDKALAWSSVPYVIDGVLVYVDNLEQHHERAKRAGAKILSPPEDSPVGRLYRTEDLEGHRWMFMQRKPHEAFEPQPIKYEN